MQVKAIKTRIFKMNENLISFIQEHLSEIPEKSILMITSKIAALSQSRVVDKNKTTKKDLVLKEADEVLGETYQSYLTIKNGTLIPAAGIDESNSETGGYILWPENPYSLAKEIHSSLKKFYKIKNLGIILTDSRCTPLRRGVTGIGIAHWGFHGIQNHIGKKDLFNREITVSTTNIVDCLASAGVLVMGESHESTPLALVRDLDNLQFSDETNVHELFIEKDKDIFKPLFK